MEFNEKLQELRKQKGLTQEELADCLYVSRTAVSKWESGRGYPSIDSLKAIAKFFSVTVDQLISTDEILVIVEEDHKEKKMHLCDLAFGLVDICTAMLLFLPFFAERAGEGVDATALLNLTGVQPYLKILYMVFVIGAVVCGVLRLALQVCRSKIWYKLKTPVSLMLGAVLSLLLVLSLQPYAAVFALILLAIKALVALKFR